MSRSRSSDNFLVRDVMPALMMTQTEGAKILRASTSLIRYNWGLWVYARAILCIGYMLQGYCAQMCTPQIFRRVVPKVVTRFCMFVSQNRAIVRAEECSSLLRSNLAHEVV